MAFLSQFVKLLHILSAIMIIAGLVGRELVRTQALKARNLDEFLDLLQLSGRFERLLLVPGSMLVLVFGLLLAWLRSWPILGFLQGAKMNWLLLSLILYAAIFMLLPLVFIPKGRQFERILSEAREKGVLSQELLGALTDRAVRRAYYIEWILYGTIFYLMVMKPF